MAELTAGERWSNRDTRGQYAAIAWLRWRIFINGFRKKGGKGDLAATLVVVPIFLVVVLGMSAGAALGAGLITHSGHLERMAWVLWAIFVITQLVNLNIGQMATTFDPTQLIRFPMSATQYVYIRLMFGMLGPGNVLIAMTSLGVAVGVIVARPGLWPYALAAMLVFCAANILFTRMVFAWVDRWLSTRRAREVFTAIIFIGSLGIQWANVTYNPAYHHHHHAEQQISAEQVQHAQALYGRAEPVLDALPPGLSALSLADAGNGRIAGFAARTLGCAAYAALFFFIFAWRMRTEFRGEALSDTANAVSRRKPSPAAKDHAAGSVLIAPAAAAPGEAQAPGMASTVAAVFGKEFLYLRRNIGLFYGLIAPLVMVFLFAGRLIARGSNDWLLPCALAYALLGVAPVAFNSFGFDTTGAQLYFIAPVRMRDVLLAKNLHVAMLACVETLAVVALVIYLGATHDAVLIVSALLWTVMTMLVEATVGNYQSISSPKRVDPGRSAQKQARPLNALLSIGILAASAALAWSVAMLTRFVHAGWLLPVIMLLLAVCAALVYWHNLGTMDAYAQARRETLFEELGKKA